MVWDFPMTYIVLILNQSYLLQNVSGCSETAFFCEEVAKYLRLRKYLDNNLQCLILLRLV